jgi:5,10-methylenetetrahydromethanopterin reductase
MWSESRWGIWLHAVRPLPELAALAEAAETLGAAAILVADEGTDRDLHVTLAALAHRTRRVLLVGAVTNPYTRHPLTTAAAFASLAELAPGRVVAGFGAGGSRVLVPLGLHPDRPFTVLRECVEAVAALLRGGTVDHNGTFEAHGALSWCPDAVAIAIAGRGPRVERFAAERADWVLLAGRPVSGVAALVERLRACGLAARGRAASIAWNPNVAWSDELRSDVRQHFAYMAVDMPPAERAALGLDDDLTARLRETFAMRGAEAAARLIPDTVLDRYAVTGDRAQVAAHLAELKRVVAPELFVFDANDYSVSFLEELAVVALAAGIAGSA